MECPAPELIAAVIQGYEECIFEDYLYIASHLAKCPRCRLTCQYFWFNKWAMEKNILTEEEK